MARSMAFFAALDALGDLHLALARQQRNGAHLAQVHADGIVGFVAKILYQIEVGEVFAFFAFPAEFLGFFEDFDAGAVQVRK